MRIAVISDIHANLEALKTCLEDIKKRNIDKIFCLGDIVGKGYHAEECVNLIRKNCEVVVQGNCDIDIFPEIYTESIHNIPLDLLKKRAIVLRDLLSEESREYLVNLPISYEFYMSGSLIRMFHAHPESTTKVIINEDSYENKYQLFEPTEYTSPKTADIVLYGHLHSPFMNKLYNKTLINVGSVGNSFNVVRDDSKDSNVLETTAVNYVILDGEYGAKEYGSNFSFEFVRVPYNIDKELQDLDKNIEPEAYRGEIKEGRYRNMSKIQEKSNELNKN